MNVTGLAFAFISSHHHFPFSFLSSFAFFLVCSSCWGCSCYATRTLLGYLYAPFSPLSFRCVLKGKGQDAEAAQHKLKKGGHSRGHGASTICQSSTPLLPLCGASIRQAEKDRGGSEGDARKNGRTGGSERKSWRERSQDKTRDPQRCRRHRGGEQLSFANKTRP